MVLNLTIPSLLIFPWDLDKIQYIIVKVLLLFQYAIPLKRRNTEPCFSNNHVSVDLTVRRGYDWDSE